MDYFQGFTENHINIERSFEYSVKIKFSQVGLTPNSCIKFMKINLKDYFKDQKIQFFP